MANNVPASNNGRTLRSIFCTNSSPKKLGVYSNRQTKVNFRTAIRQ